VDPVPPEPIDPGALLARTWRLDDGLTVRLRVARRGDAAGVRSLLDRCGVEVSDFDVWSLVRPDPRREVTLCAAAPIDGHEEIVGVGSISYEDGVPHTIVCDARVHGGGERLLDAALRELVRRRARRVA
jgi:hypothetical protein